MTEDITKLSGPELADLLDSFDADEYVAIEAARRLREDDRVAMRNLERERDGLRERVRELEDAIVVVERLNAGFVAVRVERDELRAELAGVKAELHKWCNGHQLQAFQEDCNEMHARALDAEKERDDLRAELAQCKATMAGMHAARGELQRELDAAKERIAEMDAHLRRSEPAERKALSKGDWVRNNRTGRLGEVQGPASEDGLVCVLPAGGKYGYYWAESLCEPCEQPAERKAQEERRYGREGFTRLTLDEIEMGAGSVGRGHVHGLCAHLRETLATLDAVTGLAQRWESAAHALGDDHPAARYARELLEVLNVKR